ncbi:hypothetical protein [Pseudoalteromonas sp.]|uniref:hypothetical protein n=1 Tax=Pseudoalteromonas sp. TaxID=53249 RepID=UPI003566D06C
MKLFKKALVATAVVGTFAAQAVTIAPSTKINLSSEGVALKVAPVAADVSFNVVVEKDHPATTSITLTFDKNVDLNGLLGGACAAVGGTSVKCGDITFDYGNGNFTFNNVQVKEATKTGDVDKIMFDVGIGNPMSALSSFGVTLGGTKVKIAGATNLTYDSVFNSAAVESGTFELATEKSQFSYTVTTKLDALIERESQLTFASGTTDQLKYTLVNDQTLGLAVAAANVDVIATGNFADITSMTGIAGAVVTPVASKSTGAKEFDTLTADYTAFSGSTKETVKETWTFTAPMTGAGNVIPQTGNVVSKAVVKASSNATLPTGGYVIASNVDSGKWALDATIINVPYFPVLYTGTQSSVHIANESAKDADVIVSAIDNNGTAHGPLNLGFKAKAKTVTKVSQTAIAGLFGIKDATKLSVTFNLDADKGDVSAHAFTQNANGRSEVSNSQYKGK